MAVGAPMIGSGASGEAVLILCFTYSSAGKTADCLTLLRLAALQLAVISGVDDLSRPLIGFATLAVLRVYPSAATGVVPQ